MTPALLANLLSLLAGRCLAELPEQQPEWYMPGPVAECRIFVQEYGKDGEPIVILHGGPGADHGYLVEAFRGLKRKRRLVFYDQRGSLRSPCPAAKLSFDQSVEDLEALRAALGVDQISIVAHSHGTDLAMAYLQRHPERVKGFVLMGSVAPKSPVSDAEKALWDSQQKAGEAFYERAEIKDRLRAEGLDKDDSLLTIRQQSMAWHVKFAGANIVHLDRWRLMKGGKAYYNADAADAIGKTMPYPYDYTPALRARRCPVWVIDGDHDYVDAGGKCFAMAAQDIPSVRIAVIKDAGHTAWIDDPKGFASALDAALDSSIGCR